MAQAVAHLVDVKASPSRCLLKRHRAIDRLQCECRLNDPLRVIRQAWQNHSHPSLDERHIQLALQMPLILLLSISTYQEEAFPPSAVFFL